MIKFFLPACLLKYKKKRAKIYVIRFGINKHSQAFLYITFDVSKIRVFLFIQLSMKFRKHGKHMHVKNMRRINWYLLWLWWKHFKIDIIEKLCFRTTPNCVYISLYVNKRECCSFFCRLLVVYKSPFPIFSYFLFFCVTNNFNEIFLSFFSDAHYNEAPVTPYTSAFYRCHNIWHWKSSK